jgi:hypothetical protein
MKSIVGFGLVLLSVILLAGVAGGLDQIPATGSVVYWIASVLLTLAGFAAGLLGISFLDKGE